MAKFIEDGTRYQLDDPCIAPNSAAYLWNKKMMLHMNCRGYAVSQYMDPEPRKYTHVPNLAAQSFMQPEQPYFSHHPGRFFYLRDNQTGEMFSAPYEPMRVSLDAYAFEPGLADIRWKIEKLDIELTITLSLAANDVLELWQIRVVNLSNHARDISLIPYFPVGYASWMNMGGQYNTELNAIVCSSVTPYQKVDDYFKNQHLKDLTFLSASRIPDYYEVSQAAFEGEGGLHNPSSLQHGGNLANGEAHYELPAAIMQFQYLLAPKASDSLRLCFGPAKDKAEIQQLNQRYLQSDEQQIKAESEDYFSQAEGCIKVNTPDQQFNHFVNNWLPRQVFYHGDSNRLTTDPQTRNYLQDAMGMVYLNPQACKQAIITALQQQQFSGEMPDGILLSEQAELKYINQVPHTDHPVWLAIVLNAYLQETNDYSLLEQPLAWADQATQSSVFDHVSKAMQFLCEANDERGLPYIDQGDWCDPMNMVGYQGKGVSGWLAEAISYALQLWVPVCQKLKQTQLANQFEQHATQLNQRINQYFWDGQWYGRGITDNGVLFGVSKDVEGRIFLNAQSWALLCGAANQQQSQQMLAAIDEQLDTPYGVMMSAPAFTQMRDDVGRVTQKWPGSAENGSVYNHAAAFYAASLYANGLGERAFKVLRKMIPSNEDDDLSIRGQLPVYLPNYYRGAYYQYPRTAGRSSNLFNTGTSAWFYQLLVEQLFGMRGCSEGLLVSPQLPKEWLHASAHREFRGATFDIEFVQQALPENAIQKCISVSANVSQSTTLTLSNKSTNTLLISGFTPGEHYSLTVTLSGVETELLAQTTRAKKVEYDEH
ncbi:amylo-alpha-1,6-glucosidase [Agarivorans sp. 1_MG-2023]|uniref:GH36-type glycosyl hydrolase domain-containing protein n=1 Tax=Agarivorans sp. 1_MG-2023 TaxID=3062634 RepID=UPI0026E494DE|nr:amylo-alpha-1,6-glucosidase [Agarivorans sp. 1_MG-2023]MDO6762886.1 glycosyltransferase 36 [Agarivorans sp. 1_MG-2023]